MNPIDLIRGTDGKMVLTKLQAACFHLALFGTVVGITVLRLWKFYKDGADVNLFDGAMWSLYAAAAIGHAVIDKTGAQVAAFKNKKLDAETQPAPLGPQ